MNRIAQDNTGSLWGAEDTALRRPVAVKVFSDSLSSDQHFVNGFRRQLRTAFPLLEHPGVVQVINYNYGEDGPTQFMVMEPVQGETLAQRLERDGPLRADEGLAIAADVADALGAAHQLDLTHGGLSPENVLITRNGEVKLLDFGVAGVSAGLVSAGGQGKLRLSPERAAGGEASVASDVYSFANLIYEMLAGQAPEKPVGTPAGQVSLGALVPLVGADVVQICERALDSSPESRPSMSAFSSALRRELQEAKTREGKAERLQADREASARLEAERLEKERVETERVEAERAAAARLEAERLAAERLEVEQQEAARVEAERREAERLEKQRLEAERLEAERLEAERLEAERVEAERLATERAEAARIEAARREAARVEAAQREAKSVETTPQEVSRRAARRERRDDKARLKAARREEEEAARAEAARAESARKEAERQAAEREAAAALLEAERLESESREAERLEVERQEAERQEAARREAARKEAEREEAARQKVSRRAARQERREEKAQLKAARQEEERAARAEAAGAKAAQIEAERQEAERLQAAKQEQARRESELREIKRQEAVRLKAEREASARERDLEKAREREARQALKEEARQEKARLKAVLGEAAGVKEREREAPEAHPPIRQEADTKLRRRVITALIGGSVVVVGLALIIVAQNVRGNEGTPASSSGVVATPAVSPDASLPASPPAAPPPSPSPPAGSEGTIAVPNLAGLSALEARAQLVEAGLGYGGNVPIQGTPGVVIRSDPASGERVAPGTLVKILVGAELDRLQEEQTLTLGSEPLVS